MADGNGTTSKAFRTLTFDDANRINSLGCMAKGIVTVMLTAVDAPDGCDDEALAGACWAVREMIQEMESIATEGKEASNG